MPKNEKSSRADALGSAVNEPPCARTGPTALAWNASSPATATIARAAILSTVVATATAPTDRVETRLLNAGSQSTAPATANVVSRLDPSPSSVSA